MFQVAPFDLKQDLPPSGLLSFFYAIEDQPWGFPKDVGGWKVFYWPEDVELQRAAFPFESSENTLRMHHIAFDVHWQTPVFWAMELSKETCDLEQEERNKFYDFRDKLRESCTELARHQLLGFAEDIQDDLPISVCMTLNDMRRATDESNADFNQRLRDAGADKWRLLFQLDSDSDWMWGDAGMIYFCIHEDDLKARRFDNVWLQLQCG